MLTLQASVARIRWWLVLGSMIVLLRPAPAVGGELRFGNLQTPSGAVGIVGAELGVWERHGVKVQMLPFTASINARDALVGGKIDLGITAIPNFLSAAVEADAVTIGVAVDQCASTAVMVKPESPVRTVADLKGKRVASQTATATYGMFTKRVLPQAGLKLGDVTLVNIRFQDMVSALLSGSVDAVTVVDPYLSSTEFDKAARVVTDFCPYAPVPLLLTTTDAVLKRSRDDVTRFLKGWSDAARVFEERPDQATDIYSRSLKARGYDLPREVVGRIIRRLNVKVQTLALGAPLVQYFKDEAEAMSKAGTLARIPDWARAIQMLPGGR